MSLSVCVWKTLCWREGTRKPLRSRFAGAAPTSRPSRLVEHEPRLQEWLLIEWQKAEAEPIRCWLSTLPANTRLADLVLLAKQSRIIERDYEELTRTGPL